MQTLSRTLLLDRIRNDWIEGVLIPSFHGQPPLTLHWQAVESRETDHLAFAGTITEVGWLALFARLGPAVLLLGKSGAGKTTTMLLALRELEQRARDNSSLPLPLFVSLADWQVGDDDFVEWLQRFVSRHYHFPPSVSADWIKNEALWLFIDDFDWLPPALQAISITALNAFRREHPEIPLVIGAVVPPAGLVVDGTLLLLPLTPSQIQDRLDACNPQLANSIRSLPSLCAALEKPLLLQVALVACQETIPAGWDQAVEKGQGPTLIWEHYLQQLYPEPEEREEKRAYLAWLARALERAGQTGFYLDELQPAWLESQRLIQKYAVQSRCLIGGLATLVWGGAFPLNLIGFWLLGRSLANPPEQRKAPAVWMAYLLIGFFEALLTLVLLFIIWASLQFLLSFITLELSAVSSWLLLAGGLVIAGNTALHLFLYRLIPGHHLDLEQDIKRENQIWSTAKAFRSLGRGLLHGLLVGLAGGAGIALLLGMISEVATGVLAGAGFFIIVLSFYITLNLLKGGWKSGTDAGTLRHPGAAWHMARRRVLAGMGVAAALNLLLLSPAVGLGLGLALLDQGGWPAALLAAVLGTLLFMFVNTLPFALMAALYYGGQTWIKRVVLLRLLVKSGAIPQDWPIFLEDAADHSLLKIAGGRIMFYHHELQQFLANPPGD